MPGPGIRRKRQLRAILVSTVAMAAVVIALLLKTTLITTLRSILLTQHNKIQDLQDLPNGPVRLQGVVTYADASGKRFWIQDDTGALAIAQDPVTSGIQAGELVVIEARKTHAYDPLAGLASVGLNDSKIVAIQGHKEMPHPITATLKTLPLKEKNGIRVQLEGVVHRATRDANGQIQMWIGQSEQEVLAVAPPTNGDISRWRNRKVGVVAVSDTTFNTNGGFIVSQRLWIQSISDLQIGHETPPPTPLYSIRALFQNRERETGQLIRLHGRVAARLDATSFLVEDRWGAVIAQFDDPAAVGVGSQVEAIGFPVADGFRIGLLHSTFSAVPQVDVDAPDTNSPALTTVSAIRGLSEEEADSGMPVRVTGVVTYNDSDWKQLFLQDSTGGIFIKYPDSITGLSQGRRVTVVGLTNAGDYAPVIVAPRFIPGGLAPMPPPIVITAHDAASGMLDSEFVSVEGVIHQPKVTQNPHHFTFDLYSPFGKIQMVAGPSMSGMDYVSTLADARVRVRGVCGTVFNSRRQLLGFQITLSTAKDIEVLEPAPPNPFQEPTIPIQQLLRFSPHARFDHRVKVAGSVTMLGPGFFYVQDKSGGLEIEGETHGLHPADLVEAIGYAISGGYSPAMTDAAVRVVKAGAPVEPQPVTLQSVADGSFDSRLVTLEGRLLSVVNSLHSESLVLQSGGRTFEAELYKLNSGQPAVALQEGSILRLTGIGSSQVAPSTAYLLVAQEPVGFKLVIRSPRDIKVLQPASWWNAQHTVLVLGALLTVVLATLAWGARLRQRVRSQATALRDARDKARAVHALTTAMQEVSLKQDFTARVSVQRGEEIAQLGAEFNKMLAELHARDLDKAEAEEKLKHQALTDELTGLPNRRLLSDRLSQALAIAARDSQIVAVLYIDLDGFKLVNDSLGHTIGDALLGQVAERLQSRIRKADTLSRLGGDEFTVVLTSLHAKEEAELVAKSLLEVLAKPFSIDNHVVTISASVGISMFPGNGETAADLLQQADSAMYSAKRNGKNRFLYFTPELGSLMRERVTLENQLHGAIGRGEITVEYQPQFDVDSEKLVGFEALARWTHPTLGSVPPSKFIPIAEESGLIIPLGAFVLECACSEAVGWQKISAHPIQLAVNVSSIQFTRKTFVDEVAEVLRHTGLKPALLQIELTESVMLSGAEPAADTMKRLHKLGVSIAIDDFGTGYSSLSYLPRLPFNTLKIDRAFVKELTSRKEMKAMVQSLITLATQLNMKVVVEGVETAEQLAMIKALGANHVQGFLLGRSTANPTQVLTDHAAIDSPPSATETAVKAATV